MRLVALSFAAGVLFALGLSLGGMLDTSAVVGFLDLGAWNPRLMFVMGGAIGVFLPLHRALRGGGVAEGVASDPRLGPLPLRDPKLVAGAVLFGIGWALVGYCPGPAIVSLGASAAGIGAGSSVPFALAMIAGMAAHREFARRRAAERAETVDA